MAASCTAADTVYTAVLIAASTAATIGASAGTGLFYFIAMVPATLATSRTEVDTASIAASIAATFAVSASAEQKHLSG